MKKPLFLFFAAVLLSACSNTEHRSIAQIYSEFSTAPDSTRTKVWWFHGETATTKEGITADLEAFKEAGVGGVVYYDQIHGDGAGASAIFSREWWDALIFSAQEARRLGLTFEINLSNGFVAGGPWVTKEMSMKRLCYSQILLKGGESFNGILPPPSEDEFWDIKTLAFPVPKTVKWEEKVLISETVKSDEPLVLTYDMGDTFTARSLSYSEGSRSKHPVYSMNWPGPSADHFYGDGYAQMPQIGQIEASNDGEEWWIVRDIPPLYNLHYKHKTISFPAVTARYFRLNFHDWNRPDGFNPRTLEIRGATLRSHAMTDEWENKAGLNSEYVMGNDTPEYDDSEIINPAEVVDLSALLGADGKLTWTAPSNAEQWVVMRVAQTSTRGHTKHGRPGQMGLEVDKMSVAAAQLQWDNFAQVIIDTLTAHDLRPLGVIMDSHEMGSHNWTHGYEHEFAKINGYDLTSQLPALLGYVVGSKEASDRLLFDHRKTIARLIADKYYHTLDSIAISEGLMFTAQAMGNGQSMTSDNIAAKGAVRRPQGEFWGKHINGSYDIKEAASAAHVYGKPIASAEAYTDVKYSQSLAYFKNLADFAYSAQLNEFVVCASAYQPWLDKRPGNTANGREYCLNRNNTMWPLSRGFWDYQSRCAYMMRQGEPVADLLIYLGSEVSMKLLSYRLPEIPEGYYWDVCTDDALFNHIKAHKGNIRTGGIDYKILVIERFARLTPEAEDRIAKLRKAGVMVYDARTEGDYGLKSFLDTIGLEPDAAFSSANKAEDKLYFAHRRTEDAEIYFFNNHSDLPYSGKIELRASRGKVAEYWDPIDGKRLAMPSECSADGDIIVDMKLAARESGFVILRESASMEDAALVWRKNQSEMIVPVEGSWDVDFHLPHGVKSIVMDELSDWTTFTDGDIRHHSGTAVYHKLIRRPEMREGQRVYIRINGLECTSRISINGKKVGYIWCSPWETDVTEYLNEGDNNLVLEVANQLTNRMIGDLDLPEAKRSTFATKALVQKGDELLPAGITGGVELVVR